jgi:hypothetical protein
MTATIAASGFVKGAKASAVYYSLVVTAMENGLNPFE